MSNKGQEPAFTAYKRLDYNVDGVIVDPSNGMSKRFYAACAAMQGLLSSANKRSEIVSTNSEYTDYLIPENIAQLSFIIADELLKQEDETN